MAQDTEQLVLTISADVRQMQRALNRMVGESASSTKKVQSHFDRMGRDLDRSLSRTFNGVGRTLRGGLAALGVGVGFQGATALIDSATRITNALKVAGLEGERLEAVYQRLFVSAQRNSAPLETLVTLYGRAATVQKELGVSTEELLGFTDKVALALRVAGTDAGTASGALLQLSQALGSGTVRAEEFNSILEGALPIAQAAAAGLKEAGGSVAALRQLVIDGKVSSEAFFRAFEAGASTLETRVAGAQQTVSQQLVRLRNVLVDAAREFDAATGASEGFGKAVAYVTDIIEATDFSAFGEEITKYIGWINDARIALNQWVQDHARAFGQSLGLDRIGEGLALGAQELGIPGVRSDRQMRRRFGELPLLGNQPSAQQFGDLTQSAVEAYIRQRYGNGNSTRTTETTGRLPASAPTAGTVSLSDFKPPPGRGRGGGSKGGRGESDYARETEQIRERTAAIIAETEAMAGINPLIEDYGFAIAKARAEQELINAANEDGRTITPALRAEIEGLAEAYAGAEAAAEKLAEKQDQIREAADFFADTFGGAIMDLIPAIETGNAALDRLLNTLIEAVAQAALLGKGPLAGLFGGFGGGGGLLGLLGGLFRASGGPVKKGQPYIVGEKRAELFVPDQNGTILPKVPSSAPSLPRMTAGSSGSRETIDIRLQDDSGRMAEIADQRIQTRGGTLVRVAVAQGQKQTRKNLPGMFQDMQLRDF